MLLTNKQQMPAISFDVRQDVATRLTAGQTPKSISETLTISLKTVYRLKRAFRQPDGTYLAAAASVSTKQAFDRDQLVQISEWLLDEPKLTLAELRQKAVTEECYDSIDAVPDQSTLYRQLKRMGFNWGRVKYSDPRAKRGVIKFERCAFRMAQDNGLDPTTLLSFDESNYHVWDQPRLAWGTNAKPATLEKPKGKTLRNSVYATIGFNIDADGEYKAIIHWVFIHPRKSWRPLPDEIQEYEIENDERESIKSNLSSQIIKALSAAGLKAELKKLVIRSPTNTKESMTHTLLRVFRRGSREGELRERGKGRPDTGGQLIPPTGTARMFSEYLHECLAPVLQGKGPLNDIDTECRLSADEGIEGCPDYAKVEFKPAINELSLLMDSAPSHLPSNHLTVSAFHKYVKDMLGMKGIIWTPPYSPFFNPVELFFSYTKRYIRKQAPQTVPELIARLREVSESYRQYDQRLVQKIRICNTRRAIRRKAT
jgi:transposase